VIEKLKLKISHYLIHKKYLRQRTEPFSFNKIISNASDFLIIMPYDETDFYHSLDLIKYILIHRKNITLFLSEHKYTLLPEKEKFKIVSYHDQQKTRLNLPDKSLVNRLRAKEFDIVIDLNKNEDVFFSAVSNLVTAKLRMSFVKDRSEDYYDLQIANSIENSEQIYRQFLGYLQMF
jgi:hypothetical protein